MANRTTVLGGIWASGAPDPPTGTPPAADTTYADSSLDSTTIIAGWPHAKIVDSADFNEFLRRASTLIGLQETYGILPFCASTTYPAGAKVMGADGITYSSLQAANTNKEPQTETAWWQPDILLSDFTGHQLLETNGYQLFPGGLLLQWARISFSDLASFPATYSESGIRGLFVTYINNPWPITFPTSLLAVFGTGMDDSSGVEGSEVTIGIADGTDESVYNLRIARACGWNDTPTQTGYALVLGIGY
jgi:hypothetical protein